MSKSRNSSRKIQAAIMAGLLFTALFIPALSQQGTSFQGSLRRRLYKGVETSMGGLQRQIERAQWEMPDMLDRLPDIHGLLVSGANLVRIDSQWRASEVELIEAQRNIDKASRVLSRLSHIRKLLGEGKIDPSALREERGELEAELKKLAPVLKESVTHFTRLNNEMGGIFPGDKGSQLKLTAQKLSAQEQKGARHRVAEEGKPRMSWNPVRSGRGR